jgi:hypothetical protein
VEELSRQLRSEIDALQEYIARMEDRFLAATWTAELLGPLRRLEPGLEEGELQAIVLLLRRVRDQFSVNGQLGPQISQVLARYPQYLEAPGAADNPTGPQEAALDPAPAGAAAEDEEKAETAPPRPKSPGPPVAPRPPRPGAEESEDLSGLSLDLFTGRAKAPPRENPSPSTLNLHPLGAKKRPPPGDRFSATPRQDLFLAHKIRPADLKARMQLNLPSQDQVQLDFKLQKKMSSRLANALREQAASHSLLLIPRIAQFSHQGAVVPCTAKALVSLFRPLLGNPQDWAPYQACPFMDETPELGWALVPPEALPETLGHNYLDQQQVLRQRAEELGVVPRLVRRRTLVEALYDLIAAHLVLGLKLNQRTLDATASGPTAGDFVCIYFADEGIRVRDLPRTSSHPALGVCPSL